MWLLYAFSGPVLWTVSTHIDKYLVVRMLIAAGVELIETVKG